MQKRPLSESAKKTIEQKIAKLYDHVNLECLRISRIARVEFIGESANRAVTDAGGKLEETAIRAKELSETVGNYHAQSITILGIFASLVITFSGVLQFTGSGLSSLSNVSGYKIALFVSISFFFLFNTVFLLMFCISKICGKSIAVRCQNRDCDACARCKGQIVRMSKKYPYILWFNIAALILCGVCFWIT